MDLLNAFLNTAVPLLIITLLLLFSPLILLFKFLSFVKKSFLSENVAGKVVLITGASSGIGENLAYEYARRGACLAIVARREDRLQEVAFKAREIGSPDVLVISADVSKIGDCKRFVDETVNHFGRLDHLVNNAGISEVCKFEDYAQIFDSATVMDINLWGSVYGTHFAVPYLKKSTGKLIFVSSAAAWLPMPHSGFYNASKAAMIALCETMKTEFGSSIGITIVTPGLIESEMSQKESVSQVLGFLPYMSTEKCAKTIVKGTCRGDMYVTEPSWVRVFYLLKMVFPEVMLLSLRFVFVKGPWISKKDA